MTVQSKKKSKTSQAIDFWHKATKPLYWYYEKRLLNEVTKAKTLPNHIGIIMDGNRRFAKSIGLDVKAGHDYGAKKARAVLDWCVELGIQHVTIWGFSSENKGRAEDEVDHLHSIFTQQAKMLIDDQKLHENKIKVRIIGDIESFPTETKQALAKMEAATKDYSGMSLNVALGYGGREEIVAAVQSLLKEKIKAGMTSQEIAEQVSIAEIEQHLYTAGIPDPDFVIRTSGEIRLSGFLLWQTAYSEFYFVDANWPDFRKLDFLRAIRNYQARERRFGK
ncbi:MAG TPA: di-trans,poly-cis-decaprenylcistransferase [Trueperaceae bacterium]|nr:di-trans,poly-cis-decaprenylcistransferase [Trueperaceae bacterium]